MNRVFGSVLLFQKEAYESETCLSLRGIFDTITNVAPIKFKYWLEVSVLELEPGKTIQVWPVLCHEGDLRLSKSLCEDDEFGLLFSPHDLNLNCKQIVMDILFKTAFPCDGVYTLRILYSIVDAAAGPITYSQAVINDVLDILTITYFNVQNPT